MAKCEDEGDTSVCKTVGWLTVRKIEEAARFHVVLWVSFLPSCHLGFHHNLVMVWQSPRQLFIV